MAQKEERDPRLWAIAERAFSSTYEGCYCTPQTQERETKKAYRKLQRLQKKKKPPTK